jgi:DNA modification methylase
MGQTINYDFDPMRFARLRQSALNAERVAGHTHRHYKYPARFSPTFVGTAIENFSRPGDVVLDPYMGGGTTVLEAMVRQRQAIGCDINSLAVFVARVKATPLDKGALLQVSDWATEIVPRLSYRHEAIQLTELQESQTQNMNLPRARALKKFIALALNTIDELSSKRAQEFARCALLNVSQWALNGRKQVTTLSSFRDRLVRTTCEMIDAATAFQGVVGQGVTAQPTLIHDTAENLARHRPFSATLKANLVVTSPPYPGVHVLYHRWQVDGRRETPAPYWIANCLDGQGAAYYNFGARKQEGHNDYFDASLKTLQAVRSVMHKGGVMVQMIAFSETGSQLRRYLQNMEMAGFSELRPESGRASRIWRDVPGRNWHATLQGRTRSSREVVLVHVAD